ncbi:MAG: transketolase family protein [Oscillospiraceae bacterium]|nr:transketolase family protein [Oscillospiraceae bacterium]
MSIVYNGSNDSKTFKDVFSTVIPQLCEKDPDVVYLDADLMSCIGMLKWAENNPDRAINCGIAEANMVGIASGMASAGMKPIVHSFGIFASRRVFDQAFLSAGYAKNDITVIGSDPGVCAAFNGGTHMPFEDTAIYRTLPGATVMDVCDTAMLAAVLEQSKDRAGVKYIRVARKNSVKVYGDDTEFEIGKGKLLKEGNDVLIVASGIMVAKALEAAKLLEAEGVSAAVVDMFTVKPIDFELLVQWAEKTGCAVVAENHNKIGGLCGAVCEFLASRHPVPVEFVAVEDEFGEVGPQDYLEKRFGLTAEHIVESAKMAISRK